MLATAIVPRQVYAVAHRVEQYPGRALLFGVSSVPAAVTLVVALAVSVVGIPSLMLLVPAYLGLLFLGTLVGAYFLGRRALVLAAGGGRTSDVLAAAIGALLVAIAYPIPFVGSLIFYVLTLFGAGAIILACLSHGGKYRESTAR